MKRILLTIAYDGTNFSGWQRQRSGIRTVQEELEKGCEKLFGQRTESIGASRTDAGVHALCQKAVIDAETSIPMEKIPLALNSFLPEDMAVTLAEEAEVDFNPRFRAVRKTYEYRIFNGRIRNPMSRNYSEHVREPLNVAAMAEAAKAFLGEHDFVGFCASGGSAKTTVREIYSIDVRRENDFIVIKVCGNGFLYNMVRIIAGTLIYVGNGKINAESMPEIIKSGDRTRAGKTAGPAGLTLVEIVF